MFPVDGLILIGGVLVLFAVASSKFSARLGLPVLVFYGIEVDTAPECILDELLRSRLSPDEITVGSAVDLGNVRLRMRQMSGEGVDVVGLQVQA